MSELVKIKKLFFDRNKVTQFLDKKTLKVLGRFGALVRITAQRSMRKRKKASAPGTPPHSHGNPLLKRLLFFSLEEKRKTVVVGPILLGKTSGFGVPKLHEFGGSVAFRVKNTNKIVTRQYPPRPYMKPAFDTHIGKVAAMYKGKSGNV